jgi:uncharacterized tellurite resistance protein B-like protein
MKNLKKKLSLHLLFIFLLTSFLFIFIECADARAGGGGGGGSRGGGFRSSSRSRSSRSSRPSRPMTEEEKAQLLKNYKILLILHIISFCTVFLRMPPKERDVSFYIILVIGFAISFFIYPLGFLVDGAIIYFAVRSIVKFQKLMPFGYEDEYNRKIKNEKITSCLQHSDPDFNLENFKNRVKKAFTKIQIAWTSQDLSKVRFILADGTYEQFQIQINDMKDRNIVDIMKNIEISSIELEKYESNSNYDTVYVEIKASAINFKRNIKTNKILEGSQNCPDRFTEIWCFCRNKNAKSKESNGIIEGYCPNCSTRINKTEDIKCSSCGSILKSGQLDWILAGIYQKYEWKENHNSDIPGLSNLLKYDSNFSLQNIEDKLSVIFWRIIEAQKESSLNPVLKICTDEFAKLFLEERIQSIFSNTENAGTDSIEVKGIAKSGNMHLLLAEIIWNGCMNYNGVSLHKKTLFVLKRNINCVTDINKIFCGTHCPNCGALESYNNSSICEFCNTKANDVSKDWILDNVYDSEGSIANMLLEEANDYDSKTKSLFNHSYDKTYDNLDYFIPKANKEYDTSPKPQEDKKETILNKYNSLSINKEILNKYSQKDLLRFVVSIMLADNIIDHREMQTIREIALIHNITERQIQSCINEMQMKSDPFSYTLATSNIRLDKDLLIILIIIAAADGEITDSEYSILYKTAEKINISKYELRDLINMVYEEIWNKKINLQKELYLFN